jgi:hypothetical protein
VKGDRLLIGESAIAQSTAKYTIPKGRSLFSNLQKLIKTTGTRKILLGKVLLLVLNSAIAPLILSP